MAELEQAAARAKARSDEVLERAEKWLAARTRGDQTTAARVERSDPSLAVHLRGFERKAALPADEGERRALFRRLHEHVLVLQLTDLLREIADEDCPLCRDLGAEH